MMSVTHTAHSLYDKSSTCLICSDVYICLYYTNLLGNAATYLTYADILKLQVEG